MDISLKNTDRLIRLINNILDISKIEAGHIQLDLELHRPRDFVEMAVDGIRAFAESRGIAHRVRGDHRACRRCGWTSTGWCRW